MNGFSDTFVNTKFNLINFTGVTQYFNDNWHDIRQQWVKYFNVKHHCFGQRTNNRIESLNQKLKSVITKYSSLPSFISSLDACIGALCIEKDIKLAEAIMKKTADNTNYGPHDNKYKNKLTPFAFNEYKKQVDLIDTIQFTHIDERMCVSGATNSRVIASAKTCECDFFTSMGLICSHILAFRKFNKLDLFTLEACLPRWYIENLQLMGAFDYVLDNKNAEVIQMSQQTRPRKKTAKEKYRHAADNSKELCSLMAELPDDEYKSATDRLNAFIDDLRYNRRPKQQTSALTGNFIIRKM